MADIDVEGLDREELGMAESKSSSFREPLVKSRTNRSSQIALVGANACPIQSLDYEFRLFLSLVIFVLMFSMESFLEDTLLKINKCLPVSTHQIDKVFAPSHHLMRSSLFIVSFFQM